MKLEIELNIAADATVMAGLQEHLGKEAILALFAAREVPAGKAAQKLGLSRIAFMDVLRQRGIRHADYTVGDWESDAGAIAEFERRKIGQALVVSNTSPLMYLAALAYFAILRDLFRELFIPRAVFYEITIGGARLPVAAAVQEAWESWLAVQEVGRTSQADQLQQAGSIPASPRRSCLPRRK